MTRRGKIARLPRDVREELNSRLQDGQEAKSLIPWLNSLPDVKSVLAKHFNGSPINEVNLSDWRQGGYKEWLVRRDALELVRDLDDLRGREDLDNLCSNLVQWAAVQYASLAKSLVFDEPDPRKKLVRLRELCDNATLLHRTQVAAERVAQEGYWIERQKSKDRLELEDKVRHAGLFHKMVESFVKRNSTNPPPQTPIKPN